MHRAAEAEDRRESRQGRPERRRGREEKRAGGEVEKGGGELGIDRVVRGHEQQEARVGEGRGEPASLGGGRRCRGPRRGGAQPEEGRRRRLAARRGGDGRRGGWLRDARVVPEGGRGGGGGREVAGREAAGRRPADWRGGRPGRSRGRGDAGVGEDGARQWWSWGSTGSHAGELRGSGEDERREARGSRWESRGGVELGEEERRCCGERKRKEGERRIWSRDPIANIRGLFWRWKGTIAKREKRERMAAKGRGWERKTARGRIRVWRLGGPGPGLGYSLAILETFLFCKLYFGN